MPISRRDAFPTTKPSPMCQYPSGPTRCRKAAFVEKGPVRRCSSMGSPTALSSAARPTLIAHVTTICVAGCARNFVRRPSGIILSVISVHMLLNLQWVALLPASALFSDLTVCIFCGSVSKHAACRACSSIILPACSNPLCCKSRQSKSSSLMDLRLSSLAHTRSSSSQPHILRLIPSMRYTAYSIHMYICSVYIIVKGNSG